MSDLRRDAVDVDCEGSARDGWVCQVTVGADAAATRHRVTIAAGVLKRLRPDASDPTELVADSFRFLLEREPRESVLAAFDLQVIGRYFPEWEAAVPGDPRSG